MNEHLRTQATPFSLLNPPHSISSSFPASPFFTLWGLLKGAWLHFQVEATRGSLPQGGWQEMKAAHIVPDAFQRNTSVGGGENYPSPVTCHCVCVCPWVCRFLWIRLNWGDTCKIRDVIHVHISANTYSLALDRGGFFFFFFTPHFRCRKPHPIICVSVNGILNVTPRNDNTPPGPWQGQPRDDITIFSGGQVKHVHIAAKALTKEKKFKNAAQLQHEWPRWPLSSQARISM